MDLVARIYILLTFTFISSCYANVIQERIYGGEEVNIIEAPHHVQLFAKKRYYCGGSLIKRNIVVTAAHCVSNSRITVLAGSHVLSDHLEYAYVLSAKIHPLYKQNKTPGTDIGILILDRSFRSQLIQTVRLPSRPPTIGQNVRTYGFGVTEMDDDKASLHMRKMESSIVKCNDNKEDICVKTIPDTLGACLGDSGGGLINENGELVGIASKLGSMTGECASGFPDIYLDVYSKLDYILFAIVVDEVHSMRVLLEEMLKTALQISDFTSS